MWREIDDSCGGSSRHLYKGDHLAEQRLDMIVDQKLVVETKSTHELHKSANRQVYNYLRSTNLEVGLLLHFGPDARFYRVSTATKTTQIRVIRKIRFIRMKLPSRWSGSKSRSPRRIPANRARSTKCRDVLSEV